MKILLVEDERSLSRALCRILEKEHYQVDPVYDGEDALFFMESGDYDAVILDLMIPKMDGISVLQNIRSTNQELPILILSAKSDVEDKVLGLDSGANDYLTKPFNTRELLARIRAITKTHALTDSKVTFGNIMLDRNTFELSSPAGCFRLTKKEFLLMDNFMSNPGRSLSSTRLMEKIWGYDSDADIHVVWTYISFLRKKLEALHSNVRIKSVRNLGYSLETIEEKGPSS